MLRSLTPLAFLALAACGGEKAVQISMAMASDPAPAAEPQPAEPVEDAPPAQADPAPKSSQHIALNLLIGKVDPANDPNFARIPDKYIDGPRVWGHKDAVAAFVRMAEAAAANGYPIKVVSA